MASQDRKLTPTYPDLNVFLADSYEKSVSDASVSRMGLVDISNTDFKVADILHHHHDHEK